MATKRDYYQILGVSKNANADELKKAYRNLARKHHPDIDKSEGAEKRFKEINEAYQVLSDPQKKSTYDQFGHDAFSRGGLGGTAGGQQPGRYGPFTYSYTTSGGDGMPFDFGDPFEIFNQFFGGTQFGARSARIPRY